MILATLCLLTTFPESQIPSSDGHIRAWLKPLRALAASEQVALCVDVDAVVRPGLFHYPVREGMEGLDRLATCTGRSWTRVEGVYVFRRQLGYEDQRLNTPIEHTLSFLNSLSTDDRERLIGGTLKLNLVPRNERRKIRYTVALSEKGLGDSLLAHYPGRVGMRLVLEPTATALSRTGDGDVNLNLVTGSGNVVVPDESHAGRQPSPLGGPSDGALDFGKGMILTLDEIMQQARFAFNEQIWFDSRLSQTQYFISGKYSLERLLRVIREVTVVFEPRTMPEGFKADTTSQGILAFRSLAFGSMADVLVGAGELTYGEIFDGVQTSFEEIYGSRPPRHVQLFMSQYRIQPTDTVSVNGVMSLAFAAPGIASLPTEITDSTGRTINANVPHYIKLKLDASL